MDDSDDDELDYLRLEREVDKIVPLAFWEKNDEEDDRDDELETDRAYDAQ